MVTKTNSRMVDGVPIVVNVKDFGAVGDGVADDYAAVQEALDYCSANKKILSFAGCETIAFNGRLLLGAFTHIKGDGVLFKPTSLTTSVHRDAHFKKRDTAVSIEKMWMEDVVIDGQWNKGNSMTFPDDFLALVRIEATGNAHDQNIQYHRCTFLNPAHEGTVHNVWQNSNGTWTGKISDIGMYDCHGEYTELTWASQRANMFKTISGSTDNPAEYQQYYIAGVTSLNNTCEGYRTLNDFKRGTRDIIIDHCKTYNMTDCHHSVDGVTNVTFGDGNIGYQKPNALKTKNYFEMQGSDIHVYGGKYDASNNSGAVAAFLVTDYAYPAETQTGNASYRVVIQNVDVSFVKHHGIRLINTIQCKVLGVTARETLYDAVSFEYASGHLDKDGDPIAPTQNYVDDVYGYGCRRAVSTNSDGALTLGRSLFNNGDVSVAIATKVGASNPQCIFPMGNKNPYTGMYMESGAEAPIGYIALGGTTNTGVTAVTARDDLYDSPYAVLVEDLRNVYMGMLGASGRYKIDGGERLYLSVDCKKGTSTLASIVVQQWDASGAYISSTHLNLDPQDEWKTRKLAMDFESNAAYYSVNLAPATNFNTPTLTGSTYFANLKFGEGLV